MTVKRKKHPKKKHHNVHVPENITRPGHEAGPSNPAVTATQGSSPSRAHPDPVSLGWISFESYNAPAFKFTCLLGDTVPNPTDGYAGWTTISRARRRALTEWPGVNPLTIDIPIMIDDFANNRSIERDIRQLEKMAGLDSKLNEPPLIAFDAGGVVPHDATNASQIDWVISDIKWGDSDRNMNGHRIRQAATVTVMQYIEDDSLSAATSAQRNQQRKQHRRKRGRAQRGAKHKRYVVKGANETLETIAAHQLGSAHRWRDIKKLNPSYRDPKKVLKIGTILTMP